MAAASWADAPWGRVAPEIGQSSTAPSASQGRIALRPGGPPARFLLGAELL
jgi:hypothetical protein